MFTYNDFIKISKPKSKLELLFESADKVDIDSIVNAMDDDDGVEATQTINPEDNADTDSPIDVNSIIGDDESDGVTDGVDNAFNPSEDQIEDYINSLGEETDIGQVMPEDPELDRLEKMLLQSMKTGTPVLDKKPEEFTKEETTAISNFVEQHVEEDSKEIPTSLNQMVAEYKDIFGDKQVDLMVERLNELIPVCEKHRVEFTEEEKAELFNRLVYVYANPNNTTEQMVNDAEEEMLLAFIKEKHKPITDEEIFKETIKGGAMEAGFQMPFHIIAGIIASRSSKKAYESFVSNNLRGLCKNLARENVEAILKSSGQQISNEAKEQLIRGAQRYMAKETGAYLKSSGKKTVDSALKFLTGNAGTKIIEYVGSSVPAMSKKVLPDAAKAGIQASLKTSAVKAATATASKGVVKTTAKQVGSTIGKSALKKIPVAGILIGAGFAAMEIWQNGVNARSLARAGGQLLSGVVSTVPGIGTVASIGIDVALAGEEIYHDLSVEKEKDGENAIAQTPTQQQSVNPADEFDRLVQSI